jgi:predicted O-methyltransferase YrrM
MKTVVGLVVGLLLGASVGFAAGYKMEDAQTRHAQLVAVWYADYTNCVAKIPRQSWPIAKTTQEDIAAKNRAFDLLANMDDCGSTSGIGGRRLLELGTYSGYSPVPLAMRRPRSTP